MNERTRDTDIPTSFVRCILREGTSPLLATKYPFVSLNREYRANKGRINPAGGVRPQPKQKQSRDCEIAGCINHNTARVATRLMNLFVNGGLRADSSPNRFEDS